MSERLGKFSGTMKIARTADIVASLGRMYDKNTAVLEQYVENGSDAHAKNIMVILEKSRISIFDDGHGLVPKMTPDVLGLLEAYKEDLDAGKIEENLPFEVMFSELEDSPSLKSFQWMMECIGLSSKKISHDTHTKGIKGLGTLSFQQIANRVVWHSKPAPDLALAYYKDPEIAQHPPTVMLQAATAAKIERQNLSYEMSDADPLKNPFLGEEVQSGTLVELTELREGVERSLRPGSVVRSLQERFGNDIRLGRLKIKVLDRVSSDSEIAIEVPPSAYPGLLVLHRVSALRAGRGPFEVELYYDPLGRGLYPKVARKGSEVSSITQLADFNRPPWNIGKLSGLVSYPDLSDQESPWDPQKKLPLASGPVYNQWQKRVWEWVEEIEKKMGEIDEERRLSQLEEFSKTLGEEMVEAMRETPEYKDLVIKTTPPRPTPKQKRRKKIEDRVIVSTVNEHNDGVSGARIELLEASTKDLIREAVTGKTGTISLGKNPHGRYRLRLAEVPIGASIEGMSEYVVNLRDTMPGVRETFHVVNGEPKREQQKPIGRIIIFPQGWDDIDEPYRQRLEFGVIEINTEAPALREAILNDDQEQRAILCVQYMSAAVAEYAAPEDEKREETLKGASRFFGVLLPRILGKRKRS